MRTMTAETGSAHSADDEAVRALVARMIEGWNDGNGEAFAAPFADEVDFIAFDGTHLTTKRQIASVHQDLFDKWLKGTRLTGEASVRFLTRDVALVLQRGGTVMRGRTKAAPERDSIQTLVAVREAGGWRLTSFHNTRVRPIGERFVGAPLWLVTDMLWKLVLRGTAWRTR